MAVCGLGVSLPCPVGGVLPSVPSYVTGLSAALLSLLTVLQLTDFLNLCSHIRPSSSSLILGEIGPI